MDERFLVHRLKSTRFAMLVGIVVMGLYFEYLCLFKHHIRVDLLVILVLMAAAKLLAMLYYKKFN